MRTPKGDEHAGITGKGLAMNPRRKVVESKSHSPSHVLPNDIRDVIEHSIKKLVGWIEKHNYRGYEPFDGLSSYLRPLTFGNLFAERVLQQIVLRCPFHSFL